ncbi:agglutinin biogenesis protein MshP [Massilia sp. Dwa41.01b]|uniref:agglutinin biogenesis protein MshP n=1 Tax=Massilia sp. Dwa41.01b TaxID=2709302 RepID=UPI001E3F9437|nr:agglutinin biogenesis protein MshP [Massilia sp. Dwa41.01b]
MTAIFLLVVLAGLGVALVSVFTTQQQSSLLDESGARAYQAARAGIEWGLFRKRINGACVQKFSFRPPAGSVLNNYTVTVECRDVGAAPLLQTIITATACPATYAECPTEQNPLIQPNNSADYVQRVIEVQL